MSKAEYRSAVRSRQLINAALADLLQEKALEKITVTDIVRRAGINRGTFYVHYLNVPDVLQHLIDNTFSMLREKVFESPPHEVSEYPSALFQCIQMELEKDMAFYQKVINSSAYPMMQKNLLDMILEYLHQFEDHMGFGDHAQYMLMLHFCAGGIACLYQEWFAGKIEMSLPELTEHAAHMLQKILEAN